MNTRTTQTIGASRKRKAMDEREWTQEWARGRRRRWKTGDERRVMTRLWHWTVGYLKRTPIEPGTPCLYRWAYVGLIDSFAPLFDQQYRMGVRNRRVVFTWGCALRRYTENRRSSTPVALPSEIMEQLAAEDAEPTEEDVRRWLHGAESLYQFHRKRGTDYALMMSLPVSTDSPLDEEPPVNGEEMAEWQAELRERCGGGSDKGIAQAEKSIEEKIQPKPKRLTWHGLEDNELTVADRMIYCYVRTWNFGNEQRKRRKERPKPITVNRLTATTGFRPTTVKSSIKTLIARRYLDVNLVPLPIERDPRWKGFKRLTWVPDNNHPLKLNIAAAIKRAYGKNVLKYGWARKAFGIGRTTFYSWLKRMPELSAVGEPNNGMRGVNKTALRTGHASCTK